MLEHAIHPDLPRAGASYALGGCARTAHLAVPSSLLLGVSYAVLQYHPDSLLVRVQFLLMVGVATALADNLVQSLRSWHRARRIGLLGGFSLARPATRGRHDLLLSRIAALCGAVGLANVVATGGATEGCACEVSLALTSAAAYLHIHFACAPAALG